ncbi:unnamed protein product [Peronospora belbahrii]|uniref:Uncharacterized protein n=1 Tax=Peronospora belbahrii TaxID=622444 RepID=A0AAU9L0X8_9STRA|nr:unnamed protein product [Peronospora belbahrii]CAH0515301.1 unnamed protein product [Peronospora belbahrii]
MFRETAYEQENCDAESHAAAKIIFGRNLQRRSQFLTMPSRLIVNNKIAMGDADEETSIVSTLITKTEGLA